MLSRLALGVGPFSTHGASTTPRHKMPIDFQAMTDREGCVVSTFVTPIPLAVVYGAISDLENWPWMNSECDAIEALETEGFVTRFRFHGVGGQEWVSRLFVCPEAQFLYSERLDPPSPLESLQFLRVFRDCGAAG